MELLVLILELGGTVVHLGSEFLELGGLLFDLGLKFGFLFKALGLGAFKF